MPRHLGAFPVSFSVAISFMAIVMSSIIGAISPWELVRQLGWSSAFIGLAALLVGLAQILWAEMTENRAQIMYHTAREMIDGVTTDAVDREWETFNDRG